MTPFLFSLMLLRQRNDEYIVQECRKARPNPVTLHSLHRRKQAISRRLRKSLNRELLAAV